MDLFRSLLVASLLVGTPVATLSQIDSTSCEAISEACAASCIRFKADVRFVACENYCVRNSRASASSAECLKPDAASHGVEPAVSTQTSAPLMRVLTRKADVLRGRELNAQMLEAIAAGDLRTIRRLIEVEGMSPTYVYAYDFNTQTRQFEGQVIRLRLTDIFKDANEIRGESRGLDGILKLFIELGMDVTATLDGGSADAATGTAPAGSARTAWGPSLVAMERSKDRGARVRAFEVALEHGLKPNEDVREWLFAEFPQVCGRDRSTFAIQTFDLLIKYLGTSLQDDLWRAGERGPETLPEVLDRLLSPANPSQTQRARFAVMDEVWENCIPLSRRINRYLIEGK